MPSYRRLWVLLIAILAVTFSLLGYMGVEVYRHAPPIPQSVVSGDTTIMTQQDIYAGQSAWQSIGGMELGSIWGHGAYQAPDWSADWLHRELLAWLELAAQDEYQSHFDSLTPSQQAALKFQLKREYRHNNFDPDTGVLTVSARRAAAMAKVNAYYVRLFGTAPELQERRTTYAMKEGTLPDPQLRHVMGNFFFWTAWATATDRPGQDVTYTNNWPHEPLIDNVPTAENLVWSLICLIVLVAGIGGLIWIWAFLRNHDDPLPEPPARDPLTAFSLTPSQHALGKYLLLVVGLFIFQIAAGGLLAHYTIEGQSFYGIELSRWLPYSLIRTWHLQAALYWIATGFLAAGLFLVPIIYGGRDPKWQKIGVNVLFWALGIVIAGSFIGTGLAINHLMPMNLNFWLGDQGYEYVDMGRLWQIGKFLGIAFWLVLMLRGIVPALKKSNDKSLLALLTASVVAIGLFYGAGFFYGEHTNLSVMEYWRWYIVHLWVEGFFEVFATTAIAFIFCTMGLVSRRTATNSSLASASLFMLGGVPGTFHHLYFSGTTTPVLAVGAAFSALEVVPLVVLGYEAWENWHLRKRAPWMKQVEWPLKFFIAVAFWNMLGAGVLGFMVNTPIALYYIQGLNTTATHAHAALFGVYGMLAIGFTLFILRYLRPTATFNNRLMQIGFWSLNIGLALMLFTSLLPVGFIQFAASVSKGYWYARGEALIGSDLLVGLRWFRMLGDVVFIIGALAIGWQVVSRLFFGGYQLGEIIPDDSDQKAA